MARKISWPKILTIAFISETLRDFLWSSWLVWAAPIVTGWLAYTEGWPWAIILVICLVAFAATAHGFNQYSQWQAIRTPADKIQIVDVSISVILDQNKKPSKVEYIKLGIIVRSIARFPMEARIDELETRVLNMVPDEAFFSRSVQLSISSGGHFTNGAINVSQENLANRLIPAWVNASISYGKPNHLKYRASKQWYLALNFNDQGMLDNVDKSLTDLQKAFD